MKQHLLIIMTFSALLSSSMSAENKSVSNGKIPFNVHDFGEITEGDNPAHTFYFTNNTNREIRILKVRVPCGCAETKVDRTILAPGEKTQFKVKLDSGRRRGKIRKSLYLVTDSKDAPVIKYTIAADIKPKPAPQCVAPSNIKLGKMAPETTKEVSFDIGNRGVLNLVIDKGVAASPVKLKTVLPLTIPPGGKKTLEITVTAPFYEGKFNGNLMFRTNDPVRPDLWVLVTADVVK